jgi:hypothetical protein
VHDLKHTYGHRLRAAGVGFEDRKILLSNKSEHVTRHYSASEVGALIEASEKVCELREKDKSLILWWKERDSNPRPRHYECSPLPPERSHGSAFNHKSLILLTVLLTNIGRSAVASRDEPARADGGTG